MVASTSGTVFDALQLQHGLRPTADGLVGALHGLPVRVSEERAAQRNNQKVLRLSIGTAGADAAATAAAAVREHRKQLPAKVLGVDVVDGGVVVDLPAKLTKAPASEAFAAIDAVMQGIASLPGTAPVAVEGAQLTTVDGVPRWLTATQRGELEAEAEAAAAAYASVRPNLVGGLFAGAAAAAVLAGVWAALLAYANIQAWLVAIGGGLLVAFATVYVGRRVVLPLQVGIFALTIAGVLVGEILGLALWISREFGVFDLAAAFELYREVLSEEPTDALFALGGGLVGAYFGIQTARKPSFERRIDVH